MSETHEKTTHAEKLLEQALRHLETRWEYLSLVTAEKLSAMVASLASMLAIGFFAVMILAFFSVGFAFWLGDQIGNRAGGFALAGLVFIPLAVASYYLVKPFVRTRIIENLLDHDDTQDKEGRG